MNYKTQSEKDQIHVKSNKSKIEQSHGRRPTITFSVSFFSCQFRGLLEKIRKNNTRTHTGGQIKLHPYALARPRQKRRENPAWILLTPVHQ